jgi:hypothetical protein
MATYVKCKPFGCMLIFFKDHDTSKESKSARNHCWYQCDTVTSTKGCQRGFACKTHHQNLVKMWLLQLWSKCSQRPSHPTFALSLHTSPKVRASNRKQVQWKGGWAQGKPIGKKESATRPFRRGWQHWQICYAYNLGILRT